MTRPPRLTPQNAQRILQEYARRTRKVDIDLDALAFKAQVDFIRDPSRLKAALCTRRAGKSYAAGLYLFSEALDNPGCTCVYVGLTRESAKRVMLKDVLKVIDRKLGTRVQFNESDLSVRFPNGSIIYLIGADANEGMREKLLGQKYRLVIIDECASWRSDLRDLVYNVIRPATVDELGTIVLIGTPGNVKRFFFDVTRPDEENRETGWSVHSWSAMDNPHQAKQEAIELAEIRRNNPRMMETPRFRQMKLGEWIVDDERLCYRYDELRNSVDRLPTLPAGEGWSHVVGIDLGYEDETAWVIMAYTEHDPTLYIVRTLKRPKLIIEDVARITHELVDEFDPVRIVVDGSNKQAVEEMRQRHGLALEAAQKTGKAEYISMMSSDLQTGRIKVIRGPETEDLVEEWENLVWDERSSRRVENPSCANHLADAALYAWRDSLNYASQERPDGRPLSTHERVEQLWEQRLERLRQDADREWWERAE